MHLPSLFALSLILTFNDCCASFQAMLGIFFSAKSAVLIEDVPFTEEDIRNEWVFKWWIWNTRCSSAFSMLLWLELVSPGTFSQSVIALYNNFVGAQTASHKMDRSKPSVITKSMKADVTELGSQCRYDMWVKGYSEPSIIWDVTETFMYSPCSKTPPQNIYNLYNQVGINCFIAAAIYVAVGAVSLCQVRLNKRQEYMVT